MNSNREHEEAERPEESDARSGSLLGRREYLLLGAAAVGLGSAGASASLVSAASAERNGIQFGNVVNAADDLGVSDGDRVDGILQDIANRGDTLVQFPPGVYLVGDDIVVDADNFGVESTTQDKGDVVFRAVKGRDPTMFQAGDDPKGFYVGHVTLDRRDEWDSSMSLLRGNFAGKMYVKNVEMVGWAPVSADSIAKFNVRKGGEALIDGVVQKGPITYGPYPDGQTIAFFNGYATEGAVTYRNIELHGSSESGIYAGKAFGPVRVEDSYFKNCAHSAVRVTGEDSWIKNTTIVMDIDDLHPKSQVLVDEAVLNRGIWAQSARFQHTGPLIENVDIIINNAGNGIAGILNHGDTGGARIRNTRIQCNQDDIFPILIQGENTSKAGKPYAVELDGVSVTGTGSGRSAITIRDRDGSVVRNSCIQMPNADGIEFDGTSNGSIEDTNVNVGGDATIFDGANVSTSNLTSSETCPVPKPDSWQSGDSDSTDSTTDGTTDSTTDGTTDSTTDGTTDSTTDGTTDSTTDGTTDGTSDGTTTDESTADTSTGPTRIVIAQVKEGEVSRYTMTATEGLTAGDHSASTDGNTVSGRVGRLRGVDDYYVEGYISDFSISTTEYAKVYFADDGVDMDVQNYTLMNPEDLREVDTSVLGQNVITVESTDGHASGFEFDVSGDVQPGATGENVTVENGTVRGSTVGQTAVHFTGSVSDVAVTDPQNVVVTVNGDAVASADLQTLGDDGGDLPNTIGVVGTGTSTNYDLTVSGDIAPASSSSEDVADNISGSSAEGAIQTGTHAYNFSGDLTDFAVTGNVEVYINGELVEGTDGTLERHLIVFDGSKDDEVSSYQFEASGSVVTSDEYTTNAGGEWDSLESDVGESSAVGVVHQGQDAYWFTGEIVELEVRGSAVATFQDTQ